MVIPRVNFEVYDYLLIIGKKINEPGCKTRLFMSSVRVLISNGRNPVYSRQSFTSSTAFSVSG